MFQENKNNTTMVLAAHHSQSNLSPVNLSSSVSPQQTMLAIRQQIT